MFSQNDTKWREKRSAAAKRRTEAPTHSQLLLEALDLRLQRVDVLRLPLVGHVAGVGQLRQTVQSLFQSLHVRQQLCDLEFRHKADCKTRQHVNMSRWKDVILR